MMKTRRATREMSQSSSKSFKPLLSTPVISDSKPRRTRQRTAGKSRSRVKPGSELEPPRKYQDLNHDFLIDWEGTADPFSLESGSLIYVYQQLKFGDELLTSGDFVKTSSDDQKIFGQITHLFEENNSKKLEIRIFIQIHQNELMETYEYSIISPANIERKVQVNKEGGFICDKIKEKDGNEEPADKTLCLNRSINHSKLFRGLSNTNVRLKNAIDLLTLSAAPSNLVGRCSEQQDIEDFLTTSIEMNHSTSSLYICGMPGTGKTATFLYTIDQLRESEEYHGKFEFIYVNCMKLIKPYEIYSIVCKEVCNKKLQAHDALETVNNYLKGAIKRNCFIILVDEIDALINKKQDVLYNLFNWTNLPNSNFIIAGIANTMDLSEKFIHKVSSRMGNKQLVFAPYTRDQLKDIITKRLRDTQAFSSDSILFCSAKVASYSGDARRAFQVCKKAAFLALENKQSQVELEHIQRAFKQLFASVYIQTIQVLPVYLKLVLAALCMELKNNNREVTVIERIRCRMTSFCENLVGIQSLGLKQLQVFIYRLASLNLVHVENEQVRLVVTPDDVIDGIKADQAIEKVVLSLQGS